MPEDRFPGGWDFVGRMPSLHAPPALAHARPRADTDAITAPDAARGDPAGSGATTEPGAAGPDRATPRPDEPVPRDSHGRDIVAAVLFYSGMRDLFGDDPAALAAAGARQPRIGKYTLERVLGSGGKGAVLLARNPDLDEEVAIKVLRPDGRGDRSREGARLLREGRTLARLVHPNIVPIYDAGSERGLHYIVMRRIRGTTLRQAQHGAEWQRIVELYLQAGRGLAAVHAAGLAHRDFKADNVLVDDDGHVMLADFGLVCLLGEPGLAPPAHPRVFTEAITRTGELHGTPAYMAPEALRGAPASVASDLFSFAASLFEALHGERAFAGDGDLEFIAAVQAGAVRPRPAGSAVPDWLDAAVRRALLPDPARRHSAVPELLADLDFHARDRAAAEARARKTWRRRFTAAVVTTTAAGALLGVFLGAAPDPCADPRARLDSAYSEPLRTRLLAAADPGVRLVGLLDAHAAAWTGTFTTVCTATHVDGTQSQELLDARMACLDQSRRELAALVTPLATDLEPAALDTALLAAAGLDSPRACARAGRVPQPRPDQAPAVAALADTLARVRVHELAGDYAAAAEIADVLVEQARAVDFGPLLAEVLTARGRVRRQRDAWAAARDDLSAALDLAERHALDALAVDVAGQLTKLAALGLRESALAHEWARQADRKLDRVGGDDARRAELLNNRGLVAYALDADYPQAQTLHEQALRLREALQADGVESRLRVAESHYNLGNVRCALGDIAGGLASYRESRRLHADVLGPDHPTVGELLREEAFELRRLGELDTAVARADEAVALLARTAAAPVALARAHHVASILRFDLGELATAEDHARRALALLAGGDPLHARDLAELHSGLATVLQRKRALDDARREFDAGLAALARASAPHPDVRLGLLFNRGELHVELGRPDLALADFAAARELLDADPALAGYLPYLLKGIGTAHLAAARSDDALAALREALALVPPGVDPQLRAAIEFNLATALPASERAEARRLADAAEATFAQLGDDASLADVRRFIASLPPSSPRAPTTRANP